MLLLYSGKRIKSKKKTTEHAGVPHTHTHRNNMSFPPESLLCSANPKPVLHNLFLITAIARLHKEKLPISKLFTGIQVEY